MPGNPPSDTKKGVNPTLPVDSDTEDEDVFHDARFPADEEAVSTPPLLLPIATLTNEPLVTAPPGRIPLHKIRSL